jgi:hypothetical protein
MTYFSARASGSRMTSSPVRTHPDACAIPQPRPGSTTQPSVVSRRLSGSCCTDGGFNQPDQPRPQQQHPAGQLGHPQPSADASDGITSTSFDANGRSCSARSSASGAADHLGMRLPRLLRDVRRAVGTAERPSRRPTTGGSLLAAGHARLPDWPGERPGEPSDLLGQGMPGPRDLGGCVEQPQAAHSRPREGLGGLR